MPSYWRVHEISFVVKHDMMALDPAQRAHCDEYNIVVRDDDAGQRLDKLLAARVPGLSRRRARVAIDIGGVFVDGARVKVAGRTLRVGQRVVAHLGGALARATNAVGRSARARDDAALPKHVVVYEDDDIVVVRKPSGLLTAPTPEGDRSNLAVLLGARVVHRLDLPTSGLLVFARNPAADRALSEQFRVHSVERVYQAVLAGTVADDRCTLSDAVGGKHAVTHLQVVARGVIDNVPVTRVTCRLKTGRTHQIRIHTLGMGHPVLGDARYGRNAVPRSPRLALHAAVLGFVHPRSGTALRFECDWPADLTSWWLHACTIRS